MRVQFIGDWLPGPLQGTLNTIHPASGRAFSPQLYEWLAANAHAVQGDGPITRSAGTPELFLVTQRSVLHRAYGLAIATPVMGCFTGKDGCDFRGVQLSALCAPTRPARTVGYWHGGASGLLKDESFWARYVTSGRCALDPQHQDESLGDRFFVDGTKRRCIWCGHEQRLFTGDVGADRLWLGSSTWSDL
ncbi:MAG: hypothetical protein E2591_26720 [Achromobacter sp.]|uniref:hypothetical protein n=1 Tax=Achromobacter sp. TaxID=134375 RepID=UPI0012D1B3BB|nr:hypothetical protein [Achromobacter sp.]MPS81672.1 hypothetical protein [Achromobacter sp.]